MADSLNNVYKEKRDYTFSRFKSIKNLYDEISTDTAVLKPKVKEALKANKELAFLSLSLVETKKDVDIDFNLEDCKFGNFNQKELKQKFEKLEFNTLINRLASL